MYANIDTLNLDKINYISKNIRMKNIKRRKKSLVIHKLTNQSGNVEAFSQVSHSVIIVTIWLI